MQCQYNEHGCHLKLDLLAILAMKQRSISKLNDVVNRGKRRKGLTVVYAAYFPCEVVSIDESWQVIASGEVVDVQLWGRMRG